MINQKANWFNQCLPVERIPPHSKMNKYWYSRLLILLKFNKITMAQLHHLKQTNRLLKLEQKHIYDACALVNY